jgi:uncharacterized protein (DUF362 family)
MLDNNIVAIHHMAGLSYPIAPPFHPGAAFPEYPFVTNLDESNRVYSAVRETLILLGLDYENVNTPDWNPLRQLVRPGDQVLIKPNLVMHTNRRGYDPRCVVTHGSIVRAMLDYVCVALKGEGKVIVGDAPLQKADMGQVLRVTGLDGVLDFYDRQPGVEVEFADFRLERAITEGTMVLKRENLAGSMEGYCAVDLGKRSFFDEISNSFERYRVTDYDMREMTAHHNDQVNEYLIPRTVLQSDVVLNLPKLKTHRKVGLTASLKNMVGINGVKDWLPHHSCGSREEGGDEYLYPSWRKRLDTSLDERVDMVSCRWEKYAYRLGRLLLRLSARAIPYPDPYMEGSWWGNDTLWRTVLDLNQILFYADREGCITDDIQRRYLSLVDSVMAGEGEGPLEPTPRMCGLIVAGRNPVLVDGVCARAIGFDPQKIKVIWRGMSDHHLVPFPRGQAAQVVSNEERWEHVQQWQRGDGLAFEPSRGWLGYIELAG